LIVVGMGLFFQHYGTVPHVRRALAGMSIVAAALIFSTFIKMAKTLPRHWRPWFFALLAFAATAILRWPLFWVVGALAPLALWAAWKETDR
jgi:chromate transport protein ChrA